MCSFVGKGFRAGRSLNENGSRLQMDNHWNERETNQSRRICKASAASGREGGCSSQHRWISLHKPPVTPGCVGRDGRLPWIMLDMAASGGVLLNGVAPLNTYISEKQR
jgi:hypothetical protein